MAKIKFTRIAGAVKAVCARITAVGRWIGARRFLFVWSAVSFGIAAHIGLREAIGLYSGNFVMDVDMFVLTRALDILFTFLKLFVPMFMLVVAAKYIFDCDHRSMGSASRTFRLSMIAAVAAGIAVAAFYYMNAGHIIGNNPGRYCADGLVCIFNWDMAALAGRVFLATAVGMLMTLLGLRGVYAETSFMLTKK